jgi:hypothetical protein
MKQDPSRRMMSEYRTISLDLAARMAGIDVAMTESASLFNREVVAAVRDFAREGMLQRGGAVQCQTNNLRPAQVADDLAASIARIETLTGRLRRGHFARDALVLAGMAIRSACYD